MDPFTEAELASMTPAEREAVTAEDDDSDMLTVGADDGDDAEGDTPTEAVAAEVAPVEDDTPIAPYSAAAVEGYDDKMTALETKKDDAFKKMMEGELTDTEYRVIEKEVGAEIRRLDRDMVKAEVAGEMTQQQAQNAWIDYVAAQIDGQKASGADLRASDDAMRQLDSTVRLLAAQVQQDPSMVKHLTSTKPGALISNVDKWVLNEAIEIVKTRNNLVAKPVIDKARSRAPDLSGIPPTLGRVPAAADPSTNTNEFGHIERLTGSDYERALAKLSPEQLDRFMA